jgi:hypothetical protein
VKTRSHNPLATAIGYWLPALGYRPPATGHRPTATGQRPPANGHRPTATGQRPTANGHRPTATGLRPSANGHRPLFIYSFSCFFLMGFSSVIFIYLLSCIKEVNTLGRSFSARELGTKVPTPRVLKQPLNHRYIVSSNNSSHSRILFVSALVCMARLGRPWGE